MTDDMLDRFKSEAQEAFTRWLTDIELPHLAAAHDGPCELRLSASIHVGGYASNFVPGIDCELDRVSEGDDAIDDGHGQTTCRTSRALLAGLKHAARPLEFSLYLPLAGIQLR